MVEWCASVILGAWAGPCWWGRPVGDDRVGWGNSLCSLSYTHRRRLAGYVKRFCELRCGCRQPGQPKSLRDSWQRIGADFSVPLITDTTVSSVWGGGHMGALASVALTSSSNVSLKFTFCVIRWWRPYSSSPWRLAPSSGAGRPHLSQCPLSAFGGINFLMLLSLLSLFLCLVSWKVVEVCRTKPLD